MADRSRRVRRQISDVTDEFSSDGSSGSGEDWVAPSSNSKRASGKLELPSTVKSPSATRPKRTTASVSTNSTNSSATIYKSTSPEDRRQSIRLTVKVPPSKLREVMRANEAEALKDVLGGGMIVEGRRRGAANTVSRASGRNADKPRYVEYGESDIEDDEDEETEEDEEDEEQDEDDDGEEEMNDFDEIGAEAEGGTDDEEDEDIDMDDAPQPRPKSREPPKPPKITLNTPAKAEGKPLPRPRLIVTPAQVGPVKSVEDQEMEDDPGDEEVEESSDLSDDEGVRNQINEDGEEELEDEDEEEEDAEGEDEELDEDGDDDSSDGTPASGTATPDVSKMTKRQRGRPEDQTGLMALDMAPQQRKFFTDQEKAMKKDEHARKRKELTKRKIQEEKAAALNRLLKPQASKARGAAPKPETLAGAIATAGFQLDEDEYVEKANPLFTRWISDRDGIRLGVPEEWLGKRVGALFGPPLPPPSGALIQELD